MVVTYILHVRNVYIHNAKYESHKEEEEEEEESQKIDDLPVLVTHRSRTSAMLSSKVNGPVAHGSSR